MTFCSYQYDGVLLVEQIVAEVSTASCDSSAGEGGVNAFEAIGDVQAQCSLKPADGRAAESGQLAEERDEGDDGDGEHADDDAAERAHLRGGFMIPKV